MPSVNPTKTDIRIEICADAKDAIQRGNLFRPPVFKPVELDKVVVVRGGMQSGKPTFDFVLVDETGQKFVFMLTGNIVKSLGNFVEE